MSVEVGLLFPAFVTFDERRTHELEVEVVCGQGPAWDILLFLLRTPSTLAGSSAFHDDESLDDDEIKLQIMCFCDRTWDDEHLRERPNSVLQTFDRMRKVDVVAR